MSIPDQLVTAAAEAKCIRPAAVGSSLCSGGLTVKHPECALAAAFAALPTYRAEIERATGFLIGDLTLATLARMAGEATG